MFLDWTHDRDSKPIFGDTCDYTSPDYPKPVHEALLSLGVTAPTWRWVCDKLQKLHDKGLLHTKMQSKGWCSDLARVILKSRKLQGRQEPASDKEYARDLRKIPLILL